MTVFRIVKLKKRTSDLSGTGAFNEGGRWNHEGTFALYTSENPSLALLEMLVHAEESELPPQMYLITIEVNDKLPVFEIEDKNLPKEWRLPENIQLKDLGDKMLADLKHIGIKVRSAVLPGQYNYILNPRFPEYYKHVRVIKIEPLDIDKRFLKKV